jgi:glutaredoxin
MGDNDFKLPMVGERTEFYYSKIDFKLLEDQKYEYQKMIAMMNDPEEKEKFVERIKEFILSLNNIPLPEINKEKDDEFIEKIKGENN